MENALGGVQSVLVFGGTSEIAGATLEKMVERGTKQVHLAGRSLAALSQVGKELEALGTSVTTSHWDASDIGAQERVVDEIFDSEGDFDAVLVAAGVLGDNAEFEKNPSSAGDIFVSNFAGLGVLMLAVARRLASQGHGTLIVLSSVAGNRPRRSNYVYGSTKAGIDFLSVGIGSALEGSGARVMVVRPGFVRTKMTEGMEPAPFGVDASEVGQAIVDGMARRASVVWVPPLLRYLAFVMRVLPQFAWRRLEALEERRQKRARAE